MLNQGEQKMIEDAVESGKHVRHYVAIPKFAAWITVLIFFASTIFGAGISQNQLNEQGRELVKRAEVDTQLESRLREIERQTSAQDKQFEEIMRALERIERDIRDIRK
jgi:predicted PurR-regulated permease PerM